MNPEEAKFPAIEAYEKEARMNEKTRGILPIETYERVIDWVFNQISGNSKQPRDMLDYCNTIARLGEVKRSLSETRRFREAMELAEQFKDAIEKEAGRSDKGKLAVDEDKDADASTP